MSSLAPPPRERWAALAARLADPVLEALAARELTARMPVMGKNPAPNRRSVPLEAGGRVLAGLSPWIEAEAGTPEGARRAALARQAVAALVEPGGPDAPGWPDDLGPGEILPWGHPVVGASFLAQALLRAPAALWEPLPAETKAHVLQRFRQIRRVRAVYNNWLLFSAIAETFLAWAGDDWHPMVIDYALRQHEQWYVGDSFYKDGPRFHFDYYNSFVILPMLLDIFRALPAANHPPPRMGPGDFPPGRAVIERRLARHAEIQERMVSPEGTIPPVGRSLAYRCGALQALAQAAWLGLLPPTLRPAQVRGALTAAIERSLHAPGTFTADGWLTLGWCGHQPEVCENYSFGGSAYLASLAFLPLGLPPENPFWAAPDHPWTQPHLYAGGDLPPDHALAD